MIQLPAGVITTHMSMYKGTQQKLDKWMENELLLPDDADPAGANATTVATPSAVTRNQELNCRTCDNHYEK